jgi:hypothetical protein
MSLVFQTGGNRQVREVRDKAGAAGCRERRERACFPDTEFEQFDDYAGVKQE